MILRLARKTSEAQFFFSDFNGFHVSGVEVLRWLKPVVNIFKQFFTKKHVWFVFCLQMFFPWTAIWIFHISRVFSTKTRRWLVDAWSKTWGAYVQPSMVLAWVAPGALADFRNANPWRFVPFFKGCFCKICVFFWGSLEIRRNKHKSQVPVWKLRLKTKKDLTFHLQSTLQSRNSSNGWDDSNPYR